RIITFPSFPTLRSSDLFREPFRHGFDRAGEVGGLAQPQQCPRGREPRRGTGDGVADRGDAPGYDRHGKPAPHPYPIEPTSDHEKDRKSTRLNSSHLVIS